MEKPLVFRLSDWSSAAEDGLRVAMSEDRDYIKQEVKAGISQLWCINSGAAWLVTRAEGKELVIVCLEGVGAKKIISIIANRAKKAGFETMRAHTKREGLLRMFSGLGVIKREIVLGLRL